VCCYGLHWMTQQEDMATNDLEPTTKPQRAEASGSTDSPVTFRALLIGAVLIPVNVLWMVHVEYVRYSDNVSTSALFFNAIFILLAMLLANLAFSRVQPKKALTRGEMLTVYIMVVVSMGLAGHDQMEILFSTIHYAVARATIYNGWTETVLPNLPHHLVPLPGDAVKDLYRGHSTLYTPSHYLIWLRPLAWWSAFILALVWVMMCLSSIFRRQWEAEKLTYPIADIPLLITDPAVRVLSSRAFWMAFGLAAGLRILVVTHILWPQIPALSLNVQYFPLSLDLPWSAAGQIPVCFFPFAFGLCFFVPAQVAFSIWFFFLLGRLELVSSASLGLITTATTTGSAGFPYISEQGAGAAMGVAVAVLWYARVHLTAIWRHVWHRTDMADADEPMPYRTAFWGLVVGCAFLVYFAVQAGMRPAIAGLYLTIFLLFVLTTARIRAEVGLPTIEFFMTGPDAFLKAAGGTSFYSRHELTVMSLFFWLTRTNRQFPMSAQVDAFRIAGRSGIKQRTMMHAVLIASVITVITAFWAYLHVMYQVGYESARYSQMILGAFGAAPWEQLHTSITQPRPPDFGRMGGYGSGLGFALFLSAMRSKFIGWPFHPIGYMASCSWGLTRLWVPLASTWLAKVLILRYGGLRMYKNTIPFFIGLIAGEFVIGMIVTLLGFFGIILPPESGIGGL